MDKSTIARNRRNDRLAEKLISVGGIAILICVIGVLVLLLRVTLPLFFGTQSEKISEFSLPGEGKPLILALDEYLEKALWINDRGQIHILDLKKKALALTHHLPEFKENRRIQTIERHGTGYYSILLDDGSLRLDQIELKPQFEGPQGDIRKIRPEFSNLANFPPSSFTEPPLMGQARLGEEGVVAVALLPSGRLQLVGQARSGVDEEDEDDFTAMYADEEEETETQPGYFIDAPYVITGFTLDSSARYLFAVTKAGRILRWELGEEEAELLDDIQPFSAERPLTSLSLAYGDQSLVVGDQKGGLYSLSLASTPDGAKHLQLTHKFKRHADQVASIQPSLRHKSILSLDQTGRINLDHLTSENHLLDFSTKKGISLFAFGPRGNGLLALDETGNLHLWKVDTPHPETSFKVLFGKIWYENYDEPEHIWQSSSGSDDFEAKLSLMPLIFGSLKGTLYAMIFALPIGIFGAVYTNEFASKRFREIAKPTVEISAAVPSVIIGFIAALWLAPLIHQYLLSFFVFLLLMPTGLTAFLIIWSRIRSHKKVQKFEQSRELFLMIPLTLLMLWMALQFSPLIESAFFGGNFQKWIFENVASDYDQRNSIIIAFGLGFIVIPFIFTMTDDALGSVPPSLKAASQALGASRWQTIWKVLLPSASPGLFAGVILGMGRAIGETMIVLMATGNTPIIDLSPFNGMRTLSANIAVEIPEAPVDGTLYRILFLSAVILFSFTFVINTVAEFVRSHLRRRYAQF